MMKHPPPKPDREMIELGFSALVLIAVMVTIWIVGIKT